MAGSGKRFRLGICSAAVIAASLTIAPAAFAQQDGPPAQSPVIKPDRNVFDGDYVIVGVGVMSLPSYTGSSESQIIPAAGATGEVAGVSFTIRGPSISLDLLPDRKGSDVGLRFGPQVRLRSNRIGKIKDPVVARLGKLDNVVEAGFRAGLGFDNVLSRSDSLSVGASIRWDVSGKGSGRVITPSATYLLPVSRAQAFGLLVSAEISDDSFADYNYSITPQGSAASGLPVYKARGGLEEISIGLATVRDLSGDFLDGGLSIGGGLMYSRLFGSAAKTPITSARGSRDQWIFGAGLGYTF